MPTHGSLTKAGKVRQQTPQIPKTKKRRRSFPRKRNRANYRKRILYTPGESIELSK